MKYKPLKIVALTRGLVLAALLLWAMPAWATTVTATYNSPTDIPITASSYTATGNTINFTLNCVPNPGGLTVIQNTGMNFIQGQFSNLAQGQAVTLSYEGITYNFVANYYGGNNGRSLVLICAGTRIVVSGDNRYGELAINGGTGILAGKTVIAAATDGSGQSFHVLALCSDGTLALSGDSAPTAVDMTADSALFGKTVVAVAAGGSTGLALCSDGTVAALGDNSYGELGNNSTTSSTVPVAVDMTADSALYKKTVVAIAVGTDNFCVALCSDGTVAAWGYNYDGELGNNSTTNSLVPVAVDMTADSALHGKTVVAIAAGASHSLALCSDGTVAAWGYNYYGELGNNSTTQSSVPAAVDMTADSALHGKTVVAIAGNAYNSLALCSDGTLAAWGLGGLGDNSTTTFNGDTASPVPVAVDTTTDSALYGETVVAISAGNGTGYAVCSDGSAATWGNNSPVEVSSASLTSEEGFIGFSSSGSDTLALVSWPNRPFVTTLPATGITTTTATLNGTVNDNGNSQAVAAAFDYGTTTAYGTTVTAAPAAVIGTSTTAASAAITGLVPGTLYHYRVHATTIDSVGEMIDGADQTFTAVRNSDPTIADLSVSEGVLSPAYNSTTTQYTETVTSEVSSMTVLPIVTNFATVTVDGVAVASGTASGPIALSIGTNVITIVGTSQDGTETQTYTVTVTKPPSTNTLNATYNSPTDVPATTSSGYTATGNTINFTLNCVPLTNSLMVINNTGPNFIQGQFSNLAQGQAVALTYNGQTYNYVANYYGGNGRSLVLVWQGTFVVAWGNNNGGELGNNSPYESLVPVNTSETGILAGKTVVAISAGNDFALALCSDGTLAAWGDDGAGELGNNSTTQSSVPVAVNNGIVSALYDKTVVNIAAGPNFSLALCSDGTVAGWGDNTAGELGNNSSTNSPVPVAVTTGVGTALRGKTVVSIAAGLYHSLALCSNGTVAAWGNNANGELGNNSTSSSPAPVVVNAAAGSALNGKTVVSIAAGANHCLALCSDGTVAAWGDNTYGELGNNSTTQSSVPVAVDTASNSALYGKTVVAIAAQQNLSMALCSDGTLVAWGSDNSGDLGNTSVTVGSNSLVPVVVSAAAGSALQNETVEAISAGQSLNLALCADGTIAAWGINTYGQLGNNSTTNSLLPGQVNNALLTPQERFSSISAGANFCLALVSPSVVPPLPTLATSAVSNLSLGGATLNGTVNANGYDTVVSFQYGTDGVTFPNQINVTPPGLNGTTSVAVSAPLTGLLEGETYYYQLTATNQGGTTTTPTQSFVAVSPPSASLTSAAIQSPTSVMVSGTINAGGTSTNVVFQYGTDPTFTTCITISASPDTASGYGSTSVSAVLPNLTQGITYYYRLQGVSAATGTGTSTTGSFEPQLLSALLRQFPSAPEPALGSLQINLSPTASGNYTPGWRLVGEQLWHSSGDVVSGLTTGQYGVEYRPTSGYVQPPDETGAQAPNVTSGSATELTRYYYPTPSPANLSLQIYLYPQNVAGMWRLYGSSTWNASGYVLPGLSSGTYLVECEPVSGEITPPISSVVVTAATVGTISYSPTVTPSGVAPQPLSFATITDSSTQGQTMPYAFVGQIRSDVGLSSGFVVAPYVVATAAHVVFDDGTLTANGQGTLGYVSNLQWIFEREAGTYDPVPQTPRGALVLSSYSADRIADGTPGVSSLASQNQDVAALYFSSYAGGTGGGYSGCLASDSTPNEFLTSTNDKILVGYPVDTQPANEQGDMFATPPVISAFTELSDSGGNPLQVYSTDSLYSFGGNSGGPLCVQASNGDFYPAAIYLGESAQTNVRAIDSDVINLFTVAETNGETNQNQTGGGTTLVNTTLTGGTVNLASIQVNLPGAPAGAGWSLGPIGSGDPVFSGGFSNPNLKTAEYTIYYVPVPPYYLTPANYVTTQKTQSGSYVYSETYEGISGQPTNLTATVGNSATFTVATTGTPTAYQWQYVSANNSPVNLTGPGSNTSTYTVSNLTAANVGSYQVVVTWGTDGSVTSAPATLAVSVPQPPYAFSQWLALYGLPANTPLTATPQNDGVTDAMKYVFDIDPTRPMTASDIAALPILGMTTISGQQYLTLTFRKYAYLDPSTTTLTVQTATDLASDNWTTPMGAAIVQTTGMPNTSLGDPPPGQTPATDPIMQARVPLTSPGSQFIRLEVNSQ